MRVEKVLMEQQLQETAGELVAAERELADLRTQTLRSAPAALPSLDPSEGSARAAHGPPPQPGGGGDEAAGGAGAAELAALRAENNAIMKVWGCCLYSGGVVDWCAG